MTGRFRREISEKRMEHIAREVEAYPAVPDCPQSGLWLWLIQKITSLFYWPR